MAELVKQWALERLYPRLIDGATMSYTEAVGVYDDALEVDRRFVRPGEPSETYSECYDGTWFLSMGDNLLAWVTPEGEVHLYVYRDSSQSQEVDESE